MKKLPWQTNDKAEAIRKIRDKQLWRRTIRPEQLRRFPYCQICDEKGKLTTANEVDHIKPLEQGGAPYDFENLQSLCKRCHVIKSGEESRERNKKRYSKDENNNS